MTLSNITMYNAVIPTYKGSGKNGQEKINADDPKNSNRIREILNFKK